MNLSMLKSALAEMWYLVAALGVILLVVIYQLSTGEEPAGAPETATVAGPRNVAAPAAEVAVMPQRLTEQDRARDIIADYEQRFAEDPQSGDAPALLAAMGNLNRQKLQDLEEAARYYELLLHDYPDWDGIAQVYPQLMSCYERLEDENGLRWLYTQMMEKFPPESHEYQYAQAKIDQI